MTTKIPQPNLEQVNNDLKSFMDFCRKNHLSDKDIAKICEPLTSPLAKAKLFRRVRFVAIVLLLIFTLYCLTYFETISWHLSALARIVLIKLLPFWDWRHLKNGHCILPNPIGATEISAPFFDCALCEAFDKIHVEVEVDPTYLAEHYLQLHKPVILYDALQNWPIFHSPDLSFDKAMNDSIPCKLSTNIHNGLAPLGRLLQKIGDFDEFFLHFQNCEFDATKTFRMVAPRPIFLPAETSPVQYNWLLMSRNYNVSSYKSVELREPIAVVGQANGSNFFRLVPRRNCEDECPILTIQLARGEALVLTSMWDLEYKPNAVGQNVAVILEMH